MFEETVLAYNTCQYVFDYGQKRGEVLSSMYVITFKSSDKSKIDSRIKNGNHRRELYMPGDSANIHSSYKLLPEGYV